MTLALVAENWIAGIVPRALALVRTITPTTATTATTTILLVLSALLAGPCLSVAWVLASVAEIVEVDRSGSQGSACQGARYSGVVVVVQLVLGLFW